MTSARTALVLAILLAGCSGTGDASVPSEPTTTDSPTSTATIGDECADVIEVVATQSADGTWRFDTTVSSPDEGWDKYADLWVVRTPDGETIGERVLTHPHVDEQPFTRSLSGVTLPEGIDTVDVAARDSVEGFCGEVLSVALG